MKQITFDDSLKVGIGIIDEQHEHLVELINKSGRLVEVQSPGEAFVPVVNQLIDYCIEHFSMEESLMREVGYSLSAEHKQQHNQATAEFFSIDTGALMQDPSQAMPVVEFLGSWLLDHIQKTDRELAAFLKAKNYR